MRKDIGQNLQDDLLVLISKISADDITKRNLIGLLTPDEMKPIMDYANRVNQIQLTDRTPQLEKEISEFCSPIVFETYMSWTIWLFTFHWIIRHWIHDHNVPNDKIPCNKNPNQHESNKGKKRKRIVAPQSHIYIGEATKPLGELFCSILRVLQYSSSDMAEYNKGNIYYTNMFTPIAWEIYDLNFKPTKFGCVSVRAKADEISKFTKWLKSYRYSSSEAYRNVIDCNRYPNLVNFIDMVVSTARENSAFAKRFLIKTGEEKGLIEAFGSFSSSFRKPNNICSIDSNSDEYTLRIGTGKAKITHTSPELKKLIFEGLTEQRLQALKHLETNLLLGE